MKHYRFYKIFNSSERSYLCQDCEFFTSDREQAGIFTEAAWNDWAMYGSLQREEIGADKEMRLAGAPMLPGIAN